MTIFSLSSLPPLPLSPLLSLTLPFSRSLSPPSLSPSPFSEGSPSEEDEMDKEMSVLCGVIEHLLPQVGSHVRTLDLAYGKAVTNEVVSHCSIQEADLCVLVTGTTLTVVLCPVI